MAFLAKKMFLLEMAVAGKFFVFIANPKTENSWFPACQIKQKVFIGKTFCEMIVLINFFWENTQHVQIDAAVFQGGISTCIPCPGRVWPCVIGITMIQVSALGHAGQEMGPQIANVDVLEVPRLRCVKPQRVNFAVVPPDSWSVTGHESVILIHKRSCCIYLGLPSTTVRSHAY